MNKKIMNCCGCNKPLTLVDKLDADENPQWFGKFITSNGDICVKAICAICIKDNKKKEEYIK